MAKIGVEDSLMNVQQALRNKGHEVIKLRQESDSENCDCCVVTGMNSNVMGVHDTVTQAPVIEANGLSADEVCQQVEQNLQ